MVGLHTVDANATRTNFLGDLVRTRSIGTKDVGEQAVIAVVRNVDGIVDRLERNNHNNRAEDFFTHWRHRVVATSKKGWANEVALVRPCVATVDDNFGTFRNSGFDHSLNAAKLNGRNNRANLCCCVEWIANLEGARCAFKTRNEFVITAAMHDDTSRSRADLA